MFEEKMSECTTAHELFFKNKNSMISPEKKKN